MAARYTIIRDFERPDPAVVKRINDAIFLFAVMAAGPRQVMNASIKALDPTWRICGTAFTIRSEFSEDTSMGYLAAEYAKPGDVMVCDAGGRVDCAVWGASMSRGAQEAGCVGVVLDGLCESTDHIIHREKFPMFSRGSAPHIISQDRAGWLNCPVICGGVIVNPGDIIVGNIDGVGVIPKERAADIADQAEEWTKPYRGANRVHTKKFVEAYAAPIAKIKALPGIEWK